MVRGEWKLKWILIILPSGDLPCWLAQPATAILAEIPLLVAREVSVLLLHIVSYSPRSLSASGHLASKMWSECCVSCTVMLATCSQRSSVSYQTKHSAIPGGALQRSTTSVLYFQTQIGCRMEGMGESFIRRVYGSNQNSCARSCVGFLVSITISAALSLNGIKEETKTISDLIDILYKFSKCTC